MSHNFPRNHDNYPLLRPKTLTLYRNDAVVKYHGHTMTEWHKAARRGDIDAFSKQARGRLAFVAANTDIEFITMITLTYPRDFPADGALVKTHLRAMLKRMQRKAPGYSYLWFLEFQARGAPHFHLLLTIPCDKILRTWVSQSWYDIVRSNDPYHLSAGTRCEAVHNESGARRYAVKYANKMIQKAVPPGYRNVGRFFGYSRDVEPRPISDAIGIHNRLELKAILREWYYVDKLDDANLTVLYGAAAWPNTLRDEG